ncbi:hypothetical protein [Bacillus gobiensis]|uniref:hypothetical protein n=1 Tax=Bacillus gobiensis TaxID=1441095 RepID=UPI003D1E26E0
MNQLFRKRIDIPEAEQITFESLGKVLEKTAKTFPFLKIYRVSRRKPAASAVG